MPKPANTSLVKRLDRKLRYLQDKSRAHELRAAGKGMYKVAIMQRASWDAFRQVRDILRELNSSQ